MADVTIKPVDVLEAPTVLHELDRQPIEQLGMRRPLALHAKIVRRRHDAAAEVLLPKPVDDHPRRQRMIGPREPIGKLRAPARRRLAAMDARERHRLGRRRPEKLREARRHLGFGPLPTSAFEQVRGRRLAANIAHRHRHRQLLRLQRIELRQLLLQLGKFRFFVGRQLFGLRLLFKLPVEPPLNHAGNLLFQRAALVCRLEVRSHNRRLVFFQIELPTIVVRFLKQSFDFAADGRRCFFPASKLSLIGRNCGRVGNREIIPLGHRHKERLQPVVIGLRDVVELMIVALGTSHREAHERQAGRVGHVVEDLLPPLKQVGRVVLVGIEPQETRWRPARPGCRARARRRRFAGG